MGDNKINKDEIEKALRTSLKKLQKSDAELLKNDVNERSITHHLANYLGYYFKDWDTDCEYNRNHDDPKLLNIKRRKVISNDTCATTVYPDIIIHKRKTDDNLLVIEVKKSTSSESNEYDKQKLLAFKKQLGYKYAIFCKIGTGENSKKFDIEWIHSV